MSAADANAHADALGVLRAWEPPTDGDAHLRARYVRHLESHADGLRKACFPDHLTASVIVVSPDGAQALLNHHRKANAWLTFGGHLEDDDASLAAAARRELREESGLAVFDFDPEPLSLSAHPVGFCSPRGTVTHLDVRFMATARPASAHGASAESHDVRWWPVAELPETFPDMYVLIDAAVARVGQSTSAGSTEGS